MRFIADFHIHSKYSIATSRDLSPESIWKWAQLKGISVIGTGDITHPVWIKELEEKMAGAGNGLYCLKKKYRLNGIPHSCDADVFFLLSGEISCIYSKKGKTRKIHSIIFTRDFTDATRLNKALSRIGNLAADGRPVLKLDVKELLKIVLDSSADAMLVPAHAWTPHFSVFSAGSGFDSLEECFEELTPHVYAVETGLSSNPSMNWRLSFLKRTTLISNSDAHSPNKIGREANIFDTEISYSSIMDAIESRRGFSGTIEFFPEEGKYYYDGHRSCGISMNPKETEEHNFICPICGKRLTVGVMHRIEELADREKGFRPKGSPPFYSIIPLEEIIAEILEVSAKSSTVKNEYMKLLQILGSEFKILMDVSPEDIGDAGSPILREAISRMRAGNVRIKPGFDGEYGKIKIFGSFPKGLPAYPGPIRH